MASLSADNPEVELLIDEAVRRLRPGITLTPAARVALARGLAVRLQAAPDPQDLLTQWRRQLDRYLQNLTQRMVAPGEHEIGEEDIHRQLSLCAEWCPGPAKAHVAGQS